MRVTGINASTNTMPSSDQADWVENHFVLASTAIATRYDNDPMASFARLRLSIVRRSIVLGLIVLGLIVLRLIVLRSLVTRRTGVVVMVEL